MIPKDKVKTIYDSKFMKFYDIQYEAGRHYYCASRRVKDDMPAVQPAKAYEEMLPDAVSCFVILRIKGEEPKLLLNWEYRYPAGQYLLSVPAGLIDPEDLQFEDAMERTAIREVKEETGIVFDAETDDVTIVNPFVWSTPGLTDEGNALVYLSINRDEMPELSHAGAEGSESFDGFSLLTKEEAQNLLFNGRDKNGIYYPLYTWAALMFFLGVK